jgi:hypothetical protein
MLMRAFSIAYRMPPVKRLLWRSWYQFLPRRYRDRRWTFMNYGYHPPLGAAPWRCTRRTKRIAPAFNSTAWSREQWI